MAARSLLQMFSSAQFTQLLPSPPVPAAVVWAILEGKSMSSSSREK